MNFSRRRLLQVAGLAGAVALLRRSERFIPMAYADAPSANPLLLVYMRGGWDQMLALDPRDNTDPRFQDEAARKPGGSGITPAYDRVVEKATQDLLVGNPSGIQRAGALSFGPAVPASLLRHAPDLSIIRGVSMDTLTHEVGRRYFLTGKFPRGLAASGSAITTAAASAAGGRTALPNLAVSTESYNEGLPSFASATVVSGATDLQTALKPLGKALDPRSGEALEAFQGADPTCEGVELDQDRLMTTLRESTKRSHELVRADVASLFRFSVPAPTPDVQKLFDALAIAKAADLDGPAGRAAIAGQALAHGLTDAVSVQLCDDLDDHADWDVEHAPKLRDGLEALGRLIQFLKDSPHASGGSVWSRTTMLVYSEFARTPLVNVRSGRDHFLGSSVMVSGPKIRGNMVVGATSDALMVPQNVDLATGAVRADGVKVRPADIHATLLSSMGISIDPLKNQSPNVISALLR